MTSFQIESVAFGSGDLSDWADLDPRFRNWPVVYALDGANEIYVGESLNVAGRFKQHLDSPVKRRLSRARVIVDDTFNKSACLDLESFLIRLLAGDGKFEVLNRNEGITNADYYGRREYQAVFREIFEELRREGLFSSSIQEIENSDLFKLSPFKALSQDQAIVVEDILAGLFDDIAADLPSRIVIQGDPGTGKTVVAIYLMKLVVDIQDADATQPLPDGDSALAEFFVEDHPELLAGFRIGLVVPQQSLRKSIQRVFAKTPGLDPSMVLTPYKVGESPEDFDLLIVDETHRLNQRASQPSAQKNRQYAEINRRLFGEDDPELTQLDWINARSRHQIFLVDSAQRVRPSDVTTASMDALIQTADAQHRKYRLVSQMRVQGGDEYVSYIRHALSSIPPQPRTFGAYDLRMFDDLSEMYRELRRKDSSVGLARLVAGYAWKWKSKKDKSAYDIELDGLRLRWNGTAVDWVNSPGSLDEVGSIHTIQGYDLNYAGVIIGNDLRLDPVSGRMYFDRRNYHDAKGMENNRARGIFFADDDLLDFVRNIYAVLLTRGVRGTFVYVCDAPLREYLRPLLGV